MCLTGLSHLSAVQFHSSARVQECHTCLFYNHGHASIHWSHRNFMMIIKSYLQITYPYPIAFLPTTTINHPIATMTTVSYNRGKLRFLLHSSSALSMVTIVNCEKQALRTMNNNTNDYCKYFNHCWPPKWSPYWPSKQLTIIEPVNSLLFNIFDHQLRIITISPLKGGQVEDDAANPMEVPSIWEQRPATGADSKAAPSRTGVPGDVTCWGSCHFL